MPALKCKYCNSKEIEHIKINKAGYYPEVVHELNCPLYVKGRVD